MLSCGNFCNKNSVVTKFRHLALSGPVIMMMLPLPHRVLCRCRIQCSCCSVKWLNQISASSSVVCLIELAADIDECSQIEDRVSQLCHGLCRNVEGSYICSCPLGYRMAPDGRTCQGWRPSPHFDVFFPSAFQSLWKKPRMRALAMHKTCRWCGALQRQLSVEKIPSHKKTSVLRIFIAP